MFTNFQQYFRYYLALLLSALLAVGVRLQAAPLGANAIVRGAPITQAFADNQAYSLW